MLDPLVDEPLERVEVEVLESDHASGAVLTRDNDDEMYELDVGTPIEIRLSDRTVDIVSPT